MNPPQGRSKTKIVLIVVGVLAVLAIVGGAVYALVLAGTQKTDTNTNKPQTKTQTVVSGETLTQGIDKLNKSVDKEKDQREKAQQSLNDQLKRTKLSN